MLWRVFAYCSPGFPSPTTTFTLPPRGRGRSRGTPNGPASSSGGPRAMVALPAEHGRPRLRAARAASGGGSRLDGGCLGRAMRSGCLGRVKRSGCLGPPGEARRVPRPPGEAQQVRPRGVTDKRARAHVEGAPRGAQHLQARRFPAQDAHLEAPDRHVCPARTPSRPRWAEIRSSARPLSAWGAPRVARAARVPRPGCPGASAGQPGRAATRADGNIRAGSRITIPS